MATKTSYIRLIKPLRTEKYDVGVFNDNSDKIDTMLQKALKGVELGAEDDLDDYNGAGRYYLGDGVDADAVYNKPVDCDKFNLTVLNTYDDVVMQIFATESNGIYIRAYRGNYAWTKWQLLANMDDLNDAVGDLSEEIDSKITDLELGSASKCDKTDVLAAISASDTNVPTTKAVIKYLSSVMISADNVVTGTDEDGRDLSLSGELSDIHSVTDTVKLDDGVDLSSIFTSLKGNLNTKYYYGYNASDAPVANEHYCLEVFGGPQIPNTNVIIQRYYSQSGAWYRTSSSTSSGVAYGSWVKLGG